MAGRRQAVNTCPCQAVHICSQLTWNFRSSEIVGNFCNIRIKRLLMKRRFFASAVLSVLILNMCVLSFAETSVAGAYRAQVSQLVGLLPASDGVVTLDAKRFFGDALPRLLAAKPAVLSEITGK